MNILVTGGAGFIGSNFLNLMVRRLPENHFINLDKLTYAANLLNLKSIENAHNYSFVRADIADYSSIDKVFEQYKPEMIVHFAAESHVDRSILGPSAFIQTNINGTFNLLEACRKHWKNKGDHLFLHVSTDEVYGSLGETGLFTEETAYNPSSPYSASKASSDHLVRAYHRTYGLPALITNCSNNYGPYQFPEKLIPLMILNALEGKTLPVYGTGENIRDWLYVEDHCEALWMVIEQGVPGETYNIGGNNEQKNIDVVQEICQALAVGTGKALADYTDLITFVPDRPGHDKRYAIDTSKIQKELGWSPKETFKTGLQKTIQWYLENEDWITTIKTGSYKKWLDQNYKNRVSG